MLWGGGGAEVLNLDVPWGWGMGKQSRLPVCPSRSSLAEFTLLGRGPPDTMMLSPDPTHAVGPGAVVMSCPPRVLGLSLPQSVFIFIAKCFLICETESS